MAVSFAESEHDQSTGKAIQFNVPACPHEKFYQSARKAQNVNERLQS